MEQSNLDEDDKGVLIKDHIIKKLSQEQQIPLHIVKAVIDNQFRTALGAIPTCNSIEIAGFGKFMFRKNRGTVYIKYCNKGIAKAQKLLEDTIDITDMRKEGLLVKIKDLTGIIKYLTKKIDK